MATSYPSDQPKRHHVLVLDYREQGLVPNTPTLGVLPGDTLEFRLGTAPPGRSFQITFLEPEYFSAATYAPEDAPIRVLTAPRGSTAYSCQLMRAGVPEGGPFDGGHLEEDRSHGTPR